MEAIAQPRLVFNEQRCKGCGLCVLSCPKQALEITGRLNSQGYAVAGMRQGRKCNSCAICARMCPDVAIEVWR